MDVDTITENLPDERSIELGAGVGLVVAGALATLVSLTRRRTGPLAWIVPGALLGAGALILGSGAWQERSRKIETAEEHIREDLQELDRVARAQVIKDLAQEQLEPVLPD